MRPCIINLNVINFTFLPFQQSIIVSELVRKFWSKELAAVELRNEGNKLFQRGEVEASIQRYSEAYKMAENDHLLTSNRSHAYFKKGDYVAALEDAQRTIELRPDWGKGYFRKGMALKAMGKCSFFLALKLVQLPVF